MPQAFQLDGGPHHGACLGPEGGPHPDTLFLISFDDGSAYARSGGQVRDSAGQLRELLRYDADGSVTEQAKGRFARLT